jgi:hypothetical protein
LTAARAFFRLSCLGFSLSRADFDSGRHETPCDLTRQHFCVLLRQFSQQKFIFSDDTDYPIDPTLIFPHQSRRISPQAM